MTDLWQDSEEGLAAALREHGLAPSPKKAPAPLVRPYELRPHQTKALKELDNGKILIGGTGVGKSITAAAYYVEREAPKDIYVITTPKKREHREWEEEFYKVGVAGDPDVSFYGALTVDSWNNIQKYAEVTDAFFIFDEQRLVGSGAWTKAFLKIAKRNRWILLSATPGDTWIDYIPVFIANGFYKNRTEFKREHVVYSRFSKFPKVERYLGVQKLIRLRNQLLVDMPYDRHTVRHIRYITVDHDKEQLQRVINDRWNIYTDEPLTDVAEMFRVGRRLVNGDPSRIEVVRQLVKKHPRLIIFYNFNYELDELRKFGEEWLNSRESETDSLSSTNGKAFPNERVSSSNEKSLSTLVSAGRTDTTSSPESGTAQTQNHTRPVRSAGASSATPSDTPSRAVKEWNGQKHDPLPSTDEWIYLVQYTAGAEGWNCVTTDAMSFYSLNYSFKVWHQAFGRIDRMNTPYTDLYYYVLLSKSMIDGAIMKALKEKKSFNERSTGIKF